ncbi:MAG: hypothetical protein WKG07_00270 [Hymenobacter sp.]
MVADAVTRAWGVGHTAYPELAAAAAHGGRAGCGAAGGGAVWAGGAGVCHAHARHCQGICEADCLPPCGRWWAARWWRWPCGAWAPCATPGWACRSSWRHLGTRWGRRISP